MTFFPILVLGDFECVFFLFVFLPLLAVRKLLSQASFNPIFRNLTKVSLVLLYPDADSSYLSIYSVS